jgi:hypothetical protein
MGRECGNLSHEPVDLVPVAARHPGELYIEAGLEFVTTHHASRRYAMTIRQLEL